MFKVKTDHGDYAVKVLNSEIMKRKNVWSNYALAEKFVRVACDNHINGVPAMVMNDHFIVSFKDKHYMIFDWVDGVCGINKPIDENMCYEIGRVLFNIHQLDFDYGTFHTEKSDINWDHYLELSKKQDSVVFEVLNDNIIQFKQLESYINQAKLKHPNNIISHRDLGPKNIIWKNDTAILIDWEASGPTNDTVELLETLLYWSNSGQDEALLKAFIKGYFVHTPIDKEKLNGALICTLFGKFGWLEYNMKRALGLETIDGNDQKIGENQVVATVKDIVTANNNITGVQHMINRI